MTHELGTQSIFRLLLRFSIPSLISNFLFTIYNVVDRVFISWKLGTDAIAGVGITFYLFMIFIAVGMMFGIGGGTLLLLVMTLFLGVEGPVARCINLLYFLPTALGSLYYHKKNGYLKKEAIRSAILPGVALAVAGAVAAAFVDTQLLRKAFGLYLLWAGVSVLWPKKKK